MDYKFRSRLSREAREKTQGKTVAKAANGRAIRLGGEEQRFRNAQIFVSLRDLRGFIGAFLG
jgi:hypothetical protein